MEPTKMTNGVLNGRKYTGLWKFWLSIKKSPIDFFHTDIITVFNAEDELAYQQKGHGANSDKTIKNKRISS